MKVICGDRSGNCSEVCPHREPHDPINIIITEGKDPIFCNKESEMCGIKGKRCICHTFNGSSGE